MAGHSHPLLRPLPSDVAAGEAPFINFYQKYAVFSWPWAWRRSCVFGIVAVLAGISFGVSHGLWARDVGEGILVSLACTSANLVLVGAGPLIAAFFRHRAWPRALERVLIIAAVACGMVLAEWSAHWASDVHDAFMAARGSHSTPSMSPDANVHAFVQHALQISRDMLMLFVASGGLALPAYFTEKRRWAEHWRRVALEKISQEKSEADMKLTVLQAQVEPHFLFNTLASMRSLVTSDPPRAAQTIDALARHLRATLPKIRANTGASRSTLAEQFAICESYLELMKLRLGDRLRVEIELPAALHDAPFPPLLLISLVENAIKHGVEPKPGNTRVTLSARLVQERLEVRVEDDGAGLALGMGEGTGLANIRAQLMTSFGTAATFELAARESGGVRAVIVVPHESRGA
jgi:hypothetical protein